MNSMNNCNQCKIEMNEDETHFYIKDKIFYICNKCIEINRKENENL